MPPISYSNFVDDNYELFREIAKEEDRTENEVAQEHYQAYLESINDVEN